MKLNIPWMKMFLILVIGILTTMLFMQRYSKGPDIPVKTIHDQVLVIKTDSVASRHYRDSMATEMAYRDRLLDKANADWANLAIKYNVLDQEIADLLNNPVPDSCKALQAILRAQFAQLTITSGRKDSAHSAIVQGKDAVIAGKDDLLARSAKDFARLRSNLDTCFKQQSTLTAINRGLAPRRSVVAGITSFVWPSFGIGANLGLINKQGTTYEAGIMIFQKQINYSIGVKKTLFKF